MSNPIFGNVWSMAPDPHGWVDGSPEWRNLINKLQPKKVAEVGVWMCMTTRFLLSHPCIEEVTCVDHWDALKVDPNSIDMTKQPVNRVYRMYEQFLANCLHYGLADKVYPVRMMSVEGAKYCQSLGLTFDMIWIDADHSYECVKEDIESWLPLLVEGGLMCGDDFLVVPVAKAVEEMAVKYNLTVCSLGGFWYYEKK